MGEAELNRLTIPLRLNKAVAQSISMQQQADARGDKRSSSRIKITACKQVVLDFDRADGRVSANAIIRDISETGAGLWIGTFMHPDTKCWLLLGKHNDSMLEIEGSVRWCKHFSQSVHEIGIQLYDVNKDALIAALEGQERKPASNSTDLLAAIHSSLADIRSFADKGMTPDETQALIAKLENVTSKDK